MIQSHLKPSQPSQLTLAASWKIAAADEVLIQAVGHLGAHPSSTMVAAPETSAITAPRGFVRRKKTMGGKSDSLPLQIHHDLVIIIPKDYHVIVEVGGIEKSPVDRLAIQLYIIPAVSRESVIKARIFQ